MRPTGLTCRSGCSMISTTTTCPGCAPASASRGTRKSWLMRLSSATTKQMPCSSMQAPDHAPVGALQHFHDLRLRRGRAGRCRTGAPPRGRRAAPCASPGAQEQVGAAVVRDHETEAVGVALHAPAHEAELVDDADRAAAVAHDLAVALHGGEAAREGLLLVGADVEQLRQPLRRDRDALLLQHVQDPLAAGQRDWDSARARAPGSDRTAAAWRARPLRAAWCRASRVIAQRPAGLQ